MADSERLTFLVACKKFFGSKPGQSLKEFADELAKLTPQDRADLVEIFKAVGIEIVEAQKAAA